MNKYILAALIFFLPSISLAQPCQTPLVVEVGVKASVGDAIVMIVDNPVVVDRILARYNSLEPVSDIKADMFMWFTTPRFSSVYIVFFNNSCSVGATQLPREAFDNMIGE